MKTNHDQQGRNRALAALTGHQPEQLPVAVFTWGFDYLWRVANLAPWQLAWGGSQTWRQAHMAIYERHQPDLIWCLRALIAELNERTLVLPHHSPAYIGACYTFGFERSMELMLTNPDEIRQAVRRQIEMSDSNAPFVLCTGSPIPSDVHPEAVDVMVRVARERHTRSGE